MPGQTLDPKTGLPVDPADLPILERIKRFLGVDTAPAAPAKPGATPTPTPKPLLERLTIKSEGTAPMPPRGARAGFSGKEKKETADAAEYDGNWIGSAIKHPGALHRELDVPQGQKIPQGKIAAAANSSNPTLAKRARFAEELKGFKK